MNDGWASYPAEALVLWVWSSKASYGKEANEWCSYNFISKTRKPVHGSEFANPCFRQISDLFFLVQQKRPKAGSCDSLARCWLVLPPSEGSRRAGESVFCVVHLGLTGEQSLVAFLVALLEYPYNMEAGFPQKKLFKKTESKQCFSAFCGGF